jgi:tetratricopeptide (TPR) repeat protein
MTSREKHALEEQSLKDPFLSDALDGFAENPSTLHSMKRLDKRYYRKRNIKWKISSVLIVSLAAILIYVILQDQTRNKSKTKPHIGSIQVERIPVEKLHSLIVLPKEKVLLPNEIQREFKAKDKGTVFQKNENPVFPTEELVQLPLRSIGKIDHNPLKSRTYFALETYVQDLKVLDYRYYRKKTRQEKPELLTGTPAAQENQGAGVNQKDNLEISYMNYLSNTLLDFNRGEYKAALISFDQILSSYPDDVNALFYSSLCLYNLKQFNLCEQRLKVIDLAKFDNFDEEQHWYLLLCYKAMGKTRDFTELKEEIIQLKGFYASKASSINL